MQAFFFVFATTIVSFSGATDDAITTQKNHPVWANESRLGQYQDAWKSLNQDESVVYYLAKATYQNDTGSWGDLFSCLSVQETNKNETEKTVISRFTFWNATTPSGKKYEVNETVKATKVYGYQNTENAITYYVEGGQNFSDPIVFSDGKTCDIYYAPYANNNKGGYELWVNAQNISKIPSCCLFLLDFFRKPNSTVYDIYTEGTCNKETTST